MLILVSTLLGGIGLFLLGMILMSDGLKAAAGSALQRILERSTGTSVRAFLSGIGITALVQSSSATILATIGFVSAGLLTFSSALGVIVGAAVGTTSTGWIVALLGLELNMATIAMPLIGVGAFVRLFWKGRAAHVGMAMAGFGLVFAGVDLLRTSMGDLALQMDLSGLGAPGLWTHLRLVIVGVVMTMVLQSSSVAVALTLTAVHSGAIGIEHAAFLVIGQNVGTTSTSALASIGGSVSTRRTSLGHVLFNAFAGTLAFVAVGPYLGFSTWLAEWGGVGETAVVIAVFHTVFNVSGAIIILPLLRPFSALIARLIPEKEPALTKHLDRTLLELPSVAVDAADRTMREIAILAFREARRGGAHARVATIEELRTALDETHRFLANIRASRDDRHEIARRLSLLHAGDHLSRLLGAMLRFQAEGEQQPGPHIEAAIEGMDENLSLALQWLDEREDTENVIDTLEQASQTMANDRRAHRQRLLQHTAAARAADPDQVLHRLNVMRHIDRLSYHVWRALHHLALPPDAVAFEPDAHEEIEF